MQAGGRQILIADKNYFGKDFEAELAASGIELLRPARKGEKPRPGHQFFKPVRQIIESVNDTLKGQLDLEKHGGRSIAGLCARRAVGLASGRDRPAVRRRLSTLCLKVRSGARLRTKLLQWADSKSVPADWSPDRA